MALEHLLIRNLSTGTMATLRARAARHGRSPEAEAREILASALENEPVTMAELLCTEEGADIDFEPGRLGMRRVDPWTGASR